MKKRLPPLPRLSSALCLFLCVAWQACSPMSRRISAPEAGANGGFETARSGLPVQWNLHAPDTVPEGRFQVVLDTADRVEGAQSLRFDVSECSPDGGWRSPGLFQELPATPGATYVVGFAIKNEGCAWRASFGGVTAKTGRYESVDGGEVAEEEWVRVDRRLTLGEWHDRLRFQLCVLSPGRLWIDDVRIEPVP